MSLSTEQAELRANGAMVAAPAGFSARSARQAVRAAARHIGATRPFSADEVARMARLTGLTPEEVERHGRPLRDDVSLDACGHADGPTPLEMVPDDRPGADELLEASEAAARLRAAVASLSDRDRLILEARHLSDDPALLRTLAARLGIKVERTRQLEAAALKRLQLLLRDVGPQPLGSGETAP